jgi:hypothetical protein
MKKATKRLTLAKDTLKLVKGAGNGDGIGANANTAVFTCLSCGHLKDCNGGQI